MKMRKKTFCTSRFETLRASNVQRADGQKISSRVFSCSVPCKSGKVALQLSADESANSCHGYKLLFPFQKRHWELIE